MPKKNMVVKLKADPGLAPRAKYQASQGTMVDTHGMPFASHTSATGLVVSGVEDVRIRSALSVRINSRATCEARSGLDCVSLTTIFTSKVLLPSLKPFL